MAKINYSKMLEEYMRKNKSIKKGIRLLLKNGAYINSVINAVGKTMKITRREALLIVYKNMALLPSKWVKRASNSY